METKKSGTAEDQKPAYWCTAHEASRMIANKLFPGDEASRADAQRDLYRTLMRDLRAGAVLARHPSTRLPVPIDHRVPDVAFVVARIDLIDLNRWLSHHRIRVRLGARDFSKDQAIPDDEPKRPTLTNPGPELLAKARRYADDIARQNMLRGYGGASGRDVCFSVAQRIAEDSKNALNWDGESVRKHLLKGWTFDEESRQQVAQS